MRLYGDSGWRPKPPEIKSIPNYSLYYSLSPDVGSPYAGPREPTAAQQTPVAGSSGPDNTKNQVINTGTQIMTNVPGRVGGAARTAEVVKQVPRTTQPKK